MALTGEKVGIPSADEAPMVVMARFKQPLAGLISILIVAIISIVSWWILIDPRWHNDDLVLTAASMGGFGLIGVLWAIWFENWPYYNKFRTPWKVGIVGTIINIAIMSLFLYILQPIFTNIYSSITDVTNEDVAEYIGASIFGTLSGSCFSFAVLWVAGTMYWPFFKLRQPKRGIWIWVIGTIITIIVWILLFLFTADPDSLWTYTSITSKYDKSLAWTQWTIFFSLLTLMVFEYWPWNKLSSKQPFIGIYAFIGCVVLGYLVSIWFPFISENVFEPFFKALGGVPNPDPTFHKRIWDLMSISFAIFLICAIVLVSLFFDNWPKSFTQTKNFLIRLLLVLGLGSLGFLGYYFLSPKFIGETENYFYMVPTHFLLWFLWIELLYAYVWRKWPIYKAI